MYMEEQLNLLDIMQIEECQQDTSLSDIEEYGNIVLTSSVKKDEYTQYIQEHYDLTVGDTSKVLIPNRLHLDSLKNWNIIVICGASGSGKSTVLNRIASDSGGCVSSPQFDSDKCLISNFDTMQPKEATMLLSQMGLASVPAWIRPFNALSNGEQYRASLAKSVNDAKDDEIIFVDEYTSVVDRNVAMSMSNALQKYIRAHNKRIVLATCHYDILEWLRPDYIYDLNKGGTLERGDYLRRPPISLQVYRTTIDTWDRFKKHHYLRSDINSSAVCLVFTWNDKVVAFNAVLVAPGLIPNVWREHRLVVLPDFQGLGLGYAISCWTGGVLKSVGRKYYVKTSNPALGEKRNANATVWQPTSSNMKKPSDAPARMRWGSRKTVSYCHKYVGEEMRGYEDLFLSMDEVRRLNKMRGQLTFDIDFD